MSMFRSPSRLKFSPHKSREFMRALVAAKRVASGRADLIPSTMAVSTCMGWHEDRAGSRGEERRQTCEDKDIIIFSVSRLLLASASCRSLPQAPFLVNLFSCCSQPQRPGSLSSFNQPPRREVGFVCFYLVGLLRLEVAFLQLLAHVAARFQGGLAGPFRHGRVGHRL